MTTFVANIAQELDMPEKELRKLLGRYDIELDSDPLPQSRKLLLTRIRFEGNKVHPDESGPFCFDRSFDVGCWAIASDLNLTGKTSVIAIAKWALRGAPDSDVPAPVRDWLSAVLVEGRVDALPFSIEFDPRTSAGSLTVGPTGAQSVTQFADVAQFQAEMASFFESRLGLPPIRWYQKTANDPGRATAHGWLAYLGGIWVSDAGEDLLLGETTMGDLPRRMLNMFVAVPWAPASYALGQAIRVAESKIVPVDPLSQHREEEAARVRKELAELRALGPPKIGGADVATDLADATRRWREIEQSVADLLAVRGDLRLAADDIRNDIRQIEREEAAARVLTALRPSQCPRCHHRLEPSSAPDDAICYVCSRPQATEPSGEDVLPALRTELARLSEELASADSAHSSAVGDLANAESQVRSVQQRLRQASQDTAAYPTRIARLEGYLSGLEGSPSAPPPADIAAGDDVRLLTRIRKMIEALRSAEAESRLAAINDRLVGSMHQLGFRDVRAASIESNGGLTLTYTSGRKVVFKQLAVGEKPRARIAAVLSMLASERCRHPGLVVYDSIGDKEMKRDDLSTLIGALQIAAAEDGRQVIVTVADLSLAESTLGADHVVGPASVAGHIF